MAVELQQLGLEFATQVPVSVTYRGVLVGEHRLDLLVAGSLVVELKATTDIHRAHRAQLRSYLTATGCRAGLILNFGQETLQIRRTG